MTTYERVRYRAEGGRRTVILRDPVVIDFAGGRAVTGTEVDREGANVGTAEVRERKHVIDLALVTSRKPMVLGLHYGLLEEAARR